MWTTLAALIGVALGTLVSEDLTLLGVGEAVREGRLPAWPAMLACGAGIFMGDVALLLLGRAGTHWLARWRDTQAVTTLARWLDASPGLAILGSRVLPGARLPMYLAAGAWGRRPWAVVGWMLAASAIWTPLVVGAVVLMGAGVAQVAGTSPAGAWLARLPLVACAAAAVLAARRDGVRDLAAIQMHLSRWHRWEFWPAWIVNAPVVAWVVLLAIRHRSLVVFTAANPGIEDGGFVGESKSAILARLPDPWVLPHVLIAPGPPDVRLARLRSLLTSRGLTWPLVGKPDVGQRGGAVRWLHGERDALAYLSVMPGPVVLQQAHDGPFEAGVYYVRLPGETRGRVTSITDKCFPSVVGDGSSTLEQLVRSHPRYRWQASLFLRRLASARADVPAAGVVVSLGRVGNHAQGTEFRDGRALWSEALERRIDEIASAHQGVHIGRFDVRYTDRASFMAGTDLAIVELNGVTAEPTHIYDPEARLVAAWRALMCHWSDAFRIGAAQRAAGHRPSSLRRVLRLVWQHLRTPSACVVSD